VECASLVSVSGATRHTFFQFLHDQMVQGRGFEEHSEQWAMIQQLSLYFCRHGFATALTCSLQE